MTGYLRHSQATGDAMTEDGWFRSDDLGYSIDAGSFVYLARIKDSLRLSGFLVDPREIEEFLARHEGVERPRWSASRNPVGRRAGRVRQAPGGRRSQGGGADRALSERHRGLQGAAPRVFCRRLSHDAECKRRQDPESQAPRAGRRVCRGAAPPLCYAAASPSPLADRR